MNLVIAVADDASPAARSPREDRFVNTFLIQLYKQHVAVSAHCRNRLDFRWFGAVIAVAGGAVRRREIAPNLKRIPMDTGSVVVKLTGRDAVFCHPLPVCVTVGASLR